jgi:hypothetical protein
MLRQKAGSSSAKTVRNDNSNVANDTSDVVIGDVTSGSMNLETAPGAEREIKNGKREAAIGGDFPLDLNRNQGRSLIDGIIR